MSRGCVLIALEARTTKERDRIHYGDRHDCRGDLCDPPTNDFFSVKSRTVVPSVCNRGSRWLGGRRGHPDRPLARRSTSDSASYSVTRRLTGRRASLEQAFHSAVVSWPSGRMWLGPWGSS